MSNDAIMGTIIRNTRRIKGIFINDPIFKWEELFLIEEGVNLEPERCYKILSILLDQEDPPIEKLLNNINKSNLKFAEEYGSKFYNTKLVYLRNKIFLDEPNRILYLVDLHDLYFLLNKFKKYNNNNEININLLYKDYIEDKLSHLQYYKTETQEEYIKHDNSNFPL